MACRTCQAPQGLQTCLFCGAAFCALHRADVDGATACTTCREAEVARKKRAADAAKPAKPVSDRLAAAGAIGAPVEGAEPAPLPPLPEPGGGGVVATIAALAAAAVAAFYLRWMSARTLADLAKDAQADVASAHQWLWAATIGGTAFVFVGVWLLVKSKSSRG